MLAHSEGMKAGKDAPKWDSGEEERIHKQEQIRSQNEPALKVPPRNAMAGVLLSDWAHGKVNIDRREPV